MSIFRNNGDGTFAGRVDYVTGGSSATLAIGDLNGDGKLDLAAASGISNSVSVLLGKCVTP